MPCHYVLSLLPFINWRARCFRRRMTRLVGLVGFASALLVIASACGANSVEASQYDQTCSTADDCIAVDELAADGTSCTIRCASAAINKKDKAKFDKDVSAARSDCKQTKTPFCDVSGVVECAGGRCSIGPVPTDAGAD